MEILNDVADALFEVDENVYYGTAANHNTKKAWNYTVFMRETTKAKANLTGYSDVIAVSVVRENFVPEGLLEKIVDTLSAIPGVKLDSSHDVEYVHDVKPGTTDNVEMMVIRFVRARK